MKLIRFMAGLGVVALGGALAAVEPLTGNGQGGAEVVDPAEREGIIFERQQVMTQLSRDSELLGKIVAGTEARDKLPQTTRAIAQGARDAVESYRLAVPGGQTKPEAWANQADFMARMQAFSRNADAMAAAGERNDVNAVMGLMIDALPCKQCHDLYRAKKPS